MFCTLTGVHGQSFQSYFEEAAKENPGLMAKYLQFEASLKQVAQVGSLPDPTLSIGYFLVPVETRVGPQVAKVSLSQMFPWFGTLKVKEDLASKNAQVKFMEFIAARNLLYYELKKAWYPLYELHQLIDIEKKNIALLETYERLATVHFENGQGSLVDILRVETMIEESITNLKLLEDKNTPYLVTFNRLLGRPDTTKVILPETLRQTEDLDLMYSDSMIAQHPLVLAIDNSILALQSKHRLVAKEGLPKFGVGIDYVFVSERANVMGNDNGKDAIMPMVSTSIPVFRKKYRAASEETELMISSSDLQKEQLINTMSAQLADAVYTVQAQMDRIALYDKQIRKFEQMMELYYTSYSSSGKDFEEILRLQEQILKYDKLKAGARTTLETEQARIEYLLKGGENE